MEKLVKPADYAKMMGISRQAVYMKIKKGLIPSRTIDGKLYVVVDKEDKDTEDLISEREKSIDDNRYLELIKAKDETISILKETIEDLKESNRMITTTLRSEVELLKESFYEMKRLYTLQLEDKIKDTIDIEDIIIDSFEVKEWLSIDDWILKNSIPNKKVKKITKKIKKLYKKGNKDIKVEDDIFYIKENISLKDIID